MSDIDKPVDSDATQEAADESIESIFEEAGETDVEGKGETEETNTLTLDDINGILKRDFKTKEEAMKNLDNLKRLVGNQELARERKEKKEEPKSDDKLSVLEQELAQMKKENATKDFLLAVPAAKEHLELIEAYAEKHGLSLTEAWEKKFTKFTESSQGKTVINKNRITPVQSQQIATLADRARKGDQSAQDELVAEMVWKN